MVDGVFKRLANIFSPSDSKSEGSQEPLYLTPDGKRLRNMGPVTAKSRPEAIKNWSHPFKEKSNPLEQLTQLANAASGSYPLGVGGLWHGGVHFDSGTLSSLDKASVHCIADGEVVAYCIDRNSAKTVYVVNKLHLMKPYSRNFVLVRHRLEPPAIEGETESPPRGLFFYSLYMHLQDGATYEGDLTIDRPSFWPESKICFVPETAKDVSTGTPEQYGLNVRHRAHQGKVLGFLPRGAQVTISGEGDFRKLGKFLGPSHLLNKDGSLLGYIDFDRLESVEGGEYRLKNQLNVHVDATPKSKTIGQKLPAGTQVKVSGEGEFRKLEHVTQYVYFKSLQSLRTPRYDCVNVLDEPIPIKAGELIGHIGWYQDYAADKPEKKLHLEVFSEEDVDQFIRECREWAPKLPATSKTWLKLVKGTPVVAHQDHFSTKQLPTLSTADAVSGADLLIPQSLLDSLPTAEKITVPATAGHKAYNWYRLNQLLNDVDNKLLNGWVREEVGVTPWVSPWEWHGYAVITDYTSVPAFVAAFLRTLKRFTDQQLQRYGALADAGDSGPLKERLYDIIDRDGNKKMTAEEIQAAIRIPAQAQSISQLIICCESEWYYKPQKWDGLDEMFGHGGSTPHTNWLAEKERIKQLSWWEEVAEKVGLPADGKVYHFHPIGLMGSFNIYNITNTTYRIHQSGRIEKIVLINASEEQERDACYIYIDNSGVEHDFGKFVGTKAERWVRKGVKGGEIIYLMDVSGLGSKPARNFGFRFAGTDRKYLNQSALASLIGALMDIGYQDVVSTGFSMSDGSPGVSASHINGENGDFRFLRIDEAWNTPTYLDQAAGVDALDEVRQGKMNEALYKFGWQTQYAWKYKKGGKLKLLPRTVHYDGHHHHLHVGKYTPNIIEITQ
ncbi:hypothetical protein HBO19_07175 [Pseudomonas sp. WS 5021]|uniref:hypothetical protein n=1 Tax=Pseudomonas sp. WS 5021 TaxID=2717490 RepID=UPI001472F6FD|nr:hypothetical protein [Pseudomonas sp. WS 5021]NMY25751.1 hypothetical protein [Pseudomonas sp. WS 5021]